MIDAYLHSLQKELSRGDSTEHTHRPALKALLEASVAGLLATNEPKSAERENKPDYILRKGAVILGFVEAKDIGKDLKAALKTPQLKRYLEALPNLILTNYVDFIWFVAGEKRLDISLASLGGKGLKPAPDADARWHELIHSFCNEIAPTDLGELLVDAGFSREDPADEHGEFAIRGGILDVFPANEAEPVRLEFIGDTIETLRTYDGVWLSCEGAQFPASKSQTSLDAMRRYADEGGRLYLGHFHNYWAQQNWPNNATWRSNLETLPASTLLTVYSANPEGMKFRAAIPTIKFALGENVKQSNWGEKHTTRYPQTRMGVEQFMREKFAEARDWMASMNAPTGRGARAGMPPPRRDLQLETLTEILRSQRLVHCHSYRQDEILMLMRVAEEQGFRIGTFQHILEGYKVADEMARHGAMGSSFTDWWAYKFEVYDAIPYNPALMAERGVVVSVNSDSTELARRMNFEASKVAKWGNVPPAEALKFVTINAARQLGVDKVTGSVEVGKDADLVVWSADPLSTQARTLRTYVDGQLLFERDADVAARAPLEAERNALIAEARKAREGDGAKGSKWAPAYFQSNGGCMDGHEGGQR